MERRCGRRSFEENSGIWPVDRRHGSLFWICISGAVLPEDAYLLVEEEGAEYQIPYEEAKQLFLWDEDGQEQPVRIKWRLAEYVYQVKEKIVNKKD